MKKGHDQLEVLWDNLLSRQPELIREAFTKLEPADQGAVLNHLQSMVSEPGWLPEQRLSAQAAIDVLDTKPHQD